MGKSFYKSSGTLFIVSAPSGAGKTTLCYRLAEVLPNIAFSVSHTTREPRAGEAHGRDYYFVKNEEFDEMVKTGEFVEWAEVHGNRYGTSKSELERLSAGGRDIMLDIDIQGALQIMANGIRGTFIFVLPPSMKALEERLRGRGTDNDQVIRRRLANAVGEIRLYKKYDYVIVNDDLEKAFAELKKVVELLKEISMYSVTNIDESLVKQEFGI